MRPAPEIMYRILANGGRVRHRGEVYAMGTDGSLCLVARTDSGEERPLVVDCTLAGFWAMAEEIGRDELWLQACAQLGLRQQEGAQ